MKFTDHFIERPVLATVISLLIFIFGLRAITSLQVRQFPNLENTVITISTAYPGASADVIQGFITGPIEKAIASAEGVDYLTSTSSDSVSTIKAHIRLNFPPNKALTEIMGKVAAVRNSLPRESNQPVIQKGSGRGTSLMYIGFNSDTMSAEQITDYISRIVQPKLETIKGVGEAQILGKQTFSMRVWLNPIKMAAHHVTPLEVHQAILANNYLTAAGSTKGDYVTVSAKADTSLSSVSDFEKLVVKHNKNGAITRLGDIAKVQLGSESYDSSVRFNGKKAVFVGVSDTPSANPLEVIARVRAAMPGIEKNFPSVLKAKIVYDATEFIRSSINEVIQTLFEATAIVIVVIFLFLGALRTVLIPVITIPLSLIGVCAVMLLLGYSINLLTLLAMVLAIGLVVDDAIIVVENVYRHMEEGLSVREAALVGARQIITPVISMTITLAAVYAPIGLMTGLTGSLFSEFAFTLAFAVILSGIIALTLSPMMCSRFFNKELLASPMTMRIDRFFSAVRARYEARLARVLNRRNSVIVFAVVVFASCVLLPMTIKQELAPAEDTTGLFAFVQAPQYANLDYLMKYTKQISHILMKIPERAATFEINGAEGVNTAFAGLILKPANERKKTAMQIKATLEKMLVNVAGVSAYLMLPPPLPVQGSGPPIQFVITTTSDYKTLAQVVRRFSKAVKASGLFVFSQSNLKFDKPVMSIHVDRDRAAQLGITMEQVGTAFSTLFGGNYVNRFEQSGQSYQVIPQVPRRFRHDKSELQYIYLKTPTGEVVPMSMLATATQETEPSQLAQFQQLNSATIQAVMMPGKSMGEGLKFMQDTAKRLLPEGMSYNYEGQLRQFVQEGNKMVITFAFALLIIFLVLAAQFESFSDSVVILISVPMAICGALIPLSLGLSTLNIYSQVGLVTLIGLISKHGILMVDFANKAMAEDSLSRLEAIKLAAGTRLRPILMTTAAMALGVLPLLLATGAGASSRFSIGVVIFFGMLIGTCFTLFIVPSMYMLDKKWLYWILMVLVILAAGIWLIGLPLAVLMSVIILFIPALVMKLKGRDQHANV